MITIVVPSWNAQKYMPRLVQSLRDQTNQNWRLLIVDDASTDQEYRRYLKTLESDHKITVLFLRKNRGPAGAMSVGIRAVDTPYLACLDNDNFLFPTYIERMVGFLEDNPEYGAVHCAFQQYVNMEDQNHKIGKVCITLQNSLDSAPGTCLATFRTEIALRCCPEFNLCPDYDMMLRVVEIAPVGYIEDALVGWEDHKDSLWWHNQAESERQAKACRDAAIKRRSK